MSLVAAIVFGVLFGAGIHLILRRDVIRLFGGTLVLTNAAIYLLVATGFEEQRPPLLPAASPEGIADPLAQALALTAVVIGFGTTILLLRITWALERSHHTIDVEDLAAAERAARAEALAGADAAARREGVRGLEGAGAARVGEGAGQGGRGTGRDDGRGDGAAP